jgi:hypothetical protein
MWFITKDGHFREIDGKLVNVTRGRNMENKTEHFIELMHEYFNKEQNTIDTYMATQMFNLIKISLRHATNRAIILDIKYGFAKQEQYNPLPQNLVNLIDFLESLEYIDWNSFLKQLEIIKHD